jgi:hypothetical protein
MMVFEKIMVSLVLLWPAARMIGEGILRPIGEASVRLELIVALFITPMVINIVWFWVVDNFLMSVETKHMQKGARPRMTGSTISNRAYASAMNERLVDSDEHASDCSSGDEHVEMNIGLEFLTTRVGRSLGGTKVAD